MIPQMNQPMSPQSNGKWTKSMLPVQATNAMDGLVDPKLPIPKEQQAAMLLFQVPAAIQGIPIGLIGECLAANLEFDKDQAQLHEALFEGLVPCVRTYLALAVLAPTKLEKMIMVLKETGNLPPLESVTYALKPQVSFDDTQLSQAVVEDKGCAIIWATCQSSPSLTSQAMNLEVSYKILTPSIIGAVDIELKDGDISIKSAISPRTPDDQYVQVPAVPILNLDSFTEEDSEEVSETE